MHKPIDIIITNTINKIRNKFENFNVLSEENNYFYENKNLPFVDKLINNDINTWIFVGVILISFLIIIMIIFYKK